MNCKRVIITVVNSIGPTSMPFNEFVLYRARHFADEEKHQVVVLGPIDEGFTSHDEREWSKIGVKITCCKFSYLKLILEMNKLLADYNECGIKPIVHMHHSRSALAAQLAIYLFFRKAATLFTIHNMVISFRFPSRILWYINFLIADYINFVSNYALDIFPSFLKKIRANRICSITNGVDIERVDRIIECKAPRVVPANQSKKRFELLNIGRLNEQKNQIWLIKLLSLLPRQVNLTIIGEGPLRGELESLVIKLGVEDRFRLMGLLPREQVYNALLNADLFISPSLWEGLPIAVLEAMALGQPVLVSDIGPHREIADNCDSVYMLPLGFDEWFQAIEKFMMMDKVELHALGQKNRQAVESNFSLNRMHENYTGLYRKLTGQSVWNQVEKRGN